MLGYITIPSEFMLVDCRCECAGTSCSGGIVAVGGTSLSKGAGLRADLPADVKIWVGVSVGMGMGG